MLQKNNTHIKLVLVLLFFTQCLTSPFLVIDQKLKNATVPMPVEGKGSFSLDKRQLSFGVFKSSKIHKGWMDLSKSSVFFAVAEIAEQKMHFTQYNEKGDSLMVNCLSVYVTRREKTGPINLGWEKVQPKDYFAGNISNGIDSLGYDFKVCFPDDVDFKGDIEGYLFMGEREINIKAAFESPHPMYKVNPPEGYEFFLDGKSIAAVETDSKGYVWMLPGLDDELKLTLAALSTALLMRGDLKEFVYDE